MDINFKKFQKEAIIRSLGFEKYKYIVENLYKCDIRNNPKFQRYFNSFYIVRRDEKWRNEFYDYFQSIKKKKKITFGEILNELYDRTGNIEASFSSKMLSTINPNMPIWDKYVLKELNIKFDKNSNRIENTIKAYESIVLKEKELLKKEHVKKEIEQFRETFPEYEFSDTKILDYMIWNNDRIKEN